MNLRLHSKEISFPSESEPVWAPKVDRWYQLDAPAFCLTELAWQLKDVAERPQALILACEGASNQSDFLFSSTGATSAQKFSHTLPNVRASAVLQAIGWSGPVLCFQKDPFTLASALFQVPILFPNQHVWVMHYAPQTNGSTLIECSALDAPRSAFFSIAGTDLGDLNMPDTALINWLRYFEQRSSHR